MELTKILYRVENNVAIAMLHSPKNLNAITETMLDELAEVVRLAAEDSAVKVLLFKSSIRVFSAGGNIGAMYQSLQTGGIDFDLVMRKFANVTASIKKLQKPVVCAVHGACYGCGMALPLAADYVIAAENTTFSMAFVNLGLIPDGGSLYLLSRAVGPNKAAELAMTGRTISAQEAKTLGFVAEVVPNEQMDAVVQNAVKRFSTGPACSYAEIKHLLWESDYKYLDNYFEEEAKAQVACGRTEDFAEGLKAFVEKRKANFK